MSWEIAFVLALLIGAIAAFLVEKIPVDQVAVTMFAALLLAGLSPFADKLPRVEELSTVFASPAPLAMAAMFILSAALDRCCGIGGLASSLGRLADLGYRGFLLFLILSVAAIPAFINNTPVASVFLPVMLSLALSSPLT